MRQHKMKAATTDYPYHLKVVKGFKNRATTIRQLVDTAWGFAATALWNTSIFSEKEIEQAKESIKDLFITSPKAEKAYSVFCQRVLLARQYLSNNPSKYVSLPSIWLNPDNPFGFAGTKQWYDNIRELRSSLPHFKAELKAFAEAILEMKEDPSEQNFEYWRNYFIERKAPGLLTLFFNTIARQQFGL